MRAPEPSDLMGGATSVDDVLGDPVTDDDDDDDDDGEMPLSFVLKENGWAMEESIAKFGPEAVANYFMAAGMGIAELYGLVPTDDPNSPFRKEG